MNKLLSGRRILVVEDEMMVLMLIEDMLSDLGCAAVTSAATVPKALALIGTEAFDAAMLDMNLNGEKTHSVAEALSARDVPFFFSTGYSGRDVRDGFRDLSDSRNWPKPLPSCSPNRSVFPRPNAHQSCIRR